MRKYDKLFYSILLLFCLIFEQYYGIIYIYIAYVLVCAYGMLFVRCFTFDLMYFSGLVLKKFAHFFPNCNISKRLLRQSCAVRHINMCSIYFICTCNSALVPSNTEQEKSEFHSSNTYIRRMNEAYTYIDISKWLNAKEKEKAATGKIW